MLDENCGADSCAMTPSGMRGVINDGVNLFLDANLASAFVARCCIGYKAETTEGALGCEAMSRLREPRRVCIGRHDGAVGSIDFGSL